MPKHYLLNECYLHSMGNVVVAHTDELKNFIVAASNQQQDPTADAMRNLTCLNRGLVHIQSNEAPELPLCASSFEPVNDSITVVLGPGEYGIYEVQEFSRQGGVQTLASFPHESKLLSFAHFTESATLVFVFENGDLVTAVYDTDEPVIERVGQIYCEIDSAEWSSDEETLVLVTRQKTVIVFSRDFQCLNDVELKSEDSQLSNHVDVGWGSKETQYRGAGAREEERMMIKNLDLERDANKHDPTMPMYVDKGTLTAMDTHVAEISWRKDCEVFSVSTIETVHDTPRRMIRIFSREGVLEGVSEPVDFHEGQLAWGNNIASIQRKRYDNDENSLDLIFFERNGLRHGEFDTRLPLDAPVEQIAWNSNNEVLAILSQNKVYLWTTKNYHWYLKQELTLPNINYIQWHPEKPLTLLLGTDYRLDIVDFAYKTTTGPSVAPLDLGMNLVIDGNTVNITPLSIAIVPPPMAYRDIDVPENVVDTAVSISHQYYAILTNSAVYIASCDVNTMKSGKHPNVVHETQKSEFAIDGDVLRQVSYIGDELVAVLVDSLGGSRIVLLDTSSTSDVFVKATIEAPTKVVLMKPVADWSKLSYQTIDGAVFTVSKEFNAELQDEDYVSTEVGRFPQLCADYEIATIGGKADEEYEGYSEWAEKKPTNSSVFGLTSNGKLFANSVQLSSSVTSLKISESHLLITTAQHTLRFIHLNTAEFKPLVETADVSSDERIRSIERGSLLVNILPSKSAVILQAPRGNLETINPRIMVLNEVRKDIQQKNYKSAFITCRTHRIDLDLLHDYDPELFFANIELFVKQVERVDYLDLFVSCLHEEDVTETKYKETTSDAEFDEQLKAQQLGPVQQNHKKWADPKASKINKICGAIRDVLLSSAYKTKYLQTIVTAYACEKPSNLESALNLIHTIEDSAQAEKCVVHLCFLQDVNLLYKTALGIYDIKLTLAIAQQSQMDPKEYLPFLQNLYEQTELRRKFMIDTHLQQYEKALGHLAQIYDGCALTEELKNYVLDHELYKVALSIFKYDIVKQDVILELYARSLSSKQEYVEAGLTYELLGLLEDALESYISGQRWKEALAIGEMPAFKDKFEGVADRLVSVLMESHKYCDAARIQHRLGNIPEAVSLYCKDYYYDDAIMIASSENNSRLIQDVVDPALGNGFGTIAELIADCNGQLQSQLRRLRELRDKKEQDPYAFYGQMEDSEAPDNVSLAPSETSTKDSFFTRYTGKTSGTAKTGASRKTTKNKRREERKRAKGKKGTIYEEEYLVMSVGRMIERLDQTKPEAVRLIEGLLRRGKREQAHQIQKNFADLLVHLQESVVEIYEISEKDRERVNDEGEVYYVPEIPIPAISGFPKKNVLDY